MTDAAASVLALRGTGERPDAASGVVPAKAASR